MDGQVLLSFIAIFSIFQIGFLIDILLLGRKSSNLFVAAYPGLGFGFIALFQLISGFLNFSLSNEFVVLLVLLLQLLFIIHPYIRKTFISALLDLKIRLTSLHPLTILILSLVVFFVSINTFNHMIWGYDAWAIWLAKAHAFWIDGLISKHNLNLYHPYDNPVLWPLIATWFYHITDESGGYWLRIIPLNIYLFLCLTFVLEKKNASVINQVSVLIFALTPFVWQSVVLQEYGGNADLLLSYYFLLAVVSVIVRKNLVYASIFLILAGFTKNDAIPGVVCFFVGCLVILIKDWQKDRGWAMLFPLTILIAGFILNGIWRINYGLSNRYVQRDLHVILSTRPIIQYVMYSIHAFREEFRQLYRWDLGWWIILFSFFIRVKKIARTRFFLLPVVFIASQFIGYIYAYYITPEDQATQISGSIYRLALQLFPSLLFIALTFFQEDLTFGRKSGKF